MLQILAVILPLPNILIVVDSGLSITHVSPILEMTGLSKVSFVGSIAPELLFCKS